MYKNFRVSVRGVVGVVLTVNAKLVRRDERRKASIRRDGDVDDARSSCWLFRRRVDARDVCFNRQRRAAAVVRGESVGRDHLRLVDPGSVRLAKIAVVALPFSVLQRSEKGHASTKKPPDARLPPPCVFLSAVEYANLIFRSCVRAGFVGVLSASCRFLASLSQVCTSSSSSRASSNAVRTFQGVGGVDGMAKARSRAR